MYSCFSSKKVHYEEMRGGNMWLAVWQKQIREEQDYELRSCQSFKKICKGSRKLITLFKQVNIFNQMHGLWESHAIALDSIIA